MTLHPYIFAGLPNNTLPSDLDIILSKVCQVSGVAKEDILSVIRNREFVAARQLFFYYARKNTSHSLKKIGIFLGKDHATVLHSIKAVNDLLDIKDPVMCSLIKAAGRLL